MKIKLLFSLIILSFLKLSAQQTPVIISNANIHVGNGKVIENGTLVMLNGKIDFVGKELKALYKTATTIDAKGKHVYPGLVCMNTYVGLNEIDAARATRDYSEVGSVNPNVRSMIAYNTDSKIIPTIRSNGILLTQVVPQGGLVSGSSSCMKTFGWNWEDAVYKADEGIHINWPELVVQSRFDEKDENQKQRIEKELQNIEEFFSQAEHYSKSTTIETFNARFDAMKNLFNGTKKLYIHVDFAKGIMHAINFFKKYPSIKIVLVGAQDAYQLIELLKEKNISVVLLNIHRLPQRNSEDVDQPFKTPAQLINAGILTAIGHDGSWQTRNLMFNAGTAATYGLSKEDALKCITLNAAKIMGIESTYGTLEVGKNAALLICDGDLLDMKSSNIKHAFFSGEELDLNNHQQELYKKFMNKYGF